MEDRTVIAPEERRTLEFLGYLLMQNGKWDKALALYEAVLQIDPEDPRPLLATCYLLLNLNRPKEALARLDWLMSNRPREISDTLTLLRARALLVLGRVDHAQTFLKTPELETDIHAW